MNGRMELSDKELMNVNGCVDNDFFERLKRMGEKIRKEVTPPNGPAIPYLGPDIPFVAD